MKNLKACMEVMKTFGYSKQQVQQQGNEESKGMSGSDEENLDVLRKRSLAAML